MAGLLPRLGEVGDLVLPEAALAEQFHTPEVEVGLGIVVREDQPVGHMEGQGGVFLHLQAVAGDVVWVEGEGFAQGILPRGHGLAGQP